MPIKQISSDLRNAINQVASWLGIKPHDLATVAGYETIGTFSPTITGGKGGNYRGLIQFGPTERRQYGYDPNASAADQMRGPVYRYLADRGVKPGMGLSDIYSTVLTGKPGQYSRRDSAGSVKQHVAEMRRDWAPTISRDMARGVSLIDDPDYVSTFQRQADAAIVDGPFGADVVLRAAMSGDPVKLQAALDQVVTAIEAEPFGVMKAKIQLPVYFKETAQQAPGAVMIAQTKLADPAMRAVLPANLQSLIDSTRTSAPSDPYAWMPKPTPRPTQEPAAPPFVAQGATGRGPGSMAPYGPSAPSQSVQSPVMTASAGSSMAFIPSAQATPAAPKPAPTQPPATPPEAVPAAYGTLSSILKDMGVNYMGGAGTPPAGPSPTPLPPPVDVPSLPATPYIEPPPSPPVIQPETVSMAAAQPPKPNLRPDMKAEPGILGKILQHPLGRAAVGFALGGPLGALLGGGMALAGRNGGLGALLNKSGNLPLPSNITVAPWSGSGPVNYTQSGQPMSSASGGPYMPAIYNASGVSVNKAGQMVPGSLPNLLRYPGT